MTPLIILRQKTGGYLVVTVPPDKIIREEWFTKGLMKSSRHLRKLYRKKCRVPPDHPRHGEYVRYRNTYNTVKRFARESYYLEKIQNYKHDILKNTWEMLHPIIAKNRDKTSITSEFLINDTYVSEPSAVANEFCRFFTNVGKDTQAKIPNGSRSFHQYLEQPEPKSMYLSPVTDDEIRNIVMSLKNKKSKRHDDISNSLLKKISPSILNPFI